jgi:hypothetical protein
LLVGDSRRQLLVMADLVVELYALFTHSRVSPEKPFSIKSLGKWFVLKISLRIILIFGFPTPRAGREQAEGEGEMKTVFAVLNLIFVTNWPTVGIAIE